jgi:hypothetical protein
VGARHVQLARLRPADRADVVAERDERGPDAPAPGELDTGRDAAVGLGKGPNVASRADVYWQAPYQQDRPDASSRRATSLRAASGPGAHWCHRASVSPATPVRQSGVVARESNAEAAMICAAIRAGVRAGQEGAALLIAGSWSVGTGTAASGAVSLAGPVVKVTTAAHSTTRHAARLPTASCPTRPPWRHTPVRSRAVRRPHDVASFTRALLESS